MHYIAFPKSLSLGIFMNKQKQADEGGKEKSAKMRELAEKSPNKIIEMTPDLFE